METDEEIILKIQHGKAEAYRVLVRRYTQSVRFYLAKRLNDHHEIEDLTQDVFVAAYQSLGKFEPHRKSFNGWLLTIAHNKLMSHLRKYYASKKRDLILENEILEELDSEDLFPESTMERMKHCLKKLPEAAQELIQSRYFTTEPVMLLAQRLGSSENAISSKLFRIRKTLKECIENNDD